MGTCRVLSRDFTKNYPRIVKAKGVYLWDEDGREIIDASAGAVVASIGHGRRELGDVFASQLQAVDYLHSSQFQSKALQDLVQELTAWLPAADDWYFFPCAGGSEAMESALKIARQYHFEAGETERTRFVSRETSYHGATLGALAVSGLAGRRVVYEALFQEEQYPKIPKPHHGGDGHDAEELERLLSVLPSGSCAAFIAEPISGASAPALQAGSEYYRIVRETCDRHGLLFIADEVMCGLGRCGTPFALDKWGTLPDVIVIGKGLGAGYVPAAGIAVNRKVYERLAAGSGTFMHGFTYSGHPLTAAVSTEVLRILRRESLVENSQNVGLYLLSMLEELKARNSHLGAVRGAGLLLGIDIVDSATGQPYASPGAGDRLAHSALAVGLNVYPGSGAVDGYRGDHLLLGPPLTLTREQAEEIVEKLERALLRFATTEGL